MSDIELIVKIPRSLYANLSKIQSGSIASKRILECVCNGTPLPKGHGNLIQREEAETIFRNAKMALYKQSRTEQIKDFQTRESMLLNAEQLVHLIKPIIEADKENEND